ncbi:amino acid adenylation domain-containing protein [Nonomuraea sp. NPDC052116]|uniref:non-ribosomal peptide synthetase n=1 Tax=Nonomuraea sp. NPDC052116 TaxID=3155665 RepID=UPI00341BFFA8
MTALGGDARGRPAADVFPLTDAQLAGWVARSLPSAAGGRHYAEWRLAELDAARLERACARLAERHGALRAVVLPEGRQRVPERPTELRVSLLDLRGAAPEEAAQEAAAVRARMSAAEPPSTPGPPVEVRVTLMPGGAALLHLAVDRHLADWWRFAHILVGDLAALYADPDGDPAALHTDPNGGSALGAAPPQAYHEAVLATPAGTESTGYPAARNYWLGRLADLPPAPDLPRAQSGRPRFGRRSGRLDARRWSRFTAAAARHDLTPSAALLAAFAEVLRTWAKSGRFTVRRPLAPSPGDALVLGDFTVSSLLSVEDGGGTFAERARELMDRMSEDERHADFDAVRVARELYRGRPLDERTAFPVVFADLTNRPWPVGFGRPAHALSSDPCALLEVQVWADAQGLDHHWDAREDLFPPGVPDDMRDAYAELLGELADRDEAWSAERFVLVPAAQLARRAQINETAAPHPGGLLHTPVAGHARLRPDAPAVITSDRTLTYREFSTRVNQVGRRLRELGARPNRLVAVIMEKGWEQIVAAHGVLASGAAYLPIDPAVPSARLRHLLEYGEVELVLTQDRLDASLGWPGDVRRLRVDADADFGEVSGAALEAVQRPSDLAYVIFTSGSTGTPKGVMVDHRGALNTIEDVNRRFAVGPGDRCLAVSGLHFDLSVYDVFGIPAAGGAVVVPDASAAPDPAHWAKLMESHGVTFWNSVPALAEMMVTWVELARRPETAASMQLMILAGDWIPVTLPDRVRALSPGTQVIASGGPAETCVWSVIYPVGEVDPSWTSIPYGRPMTNQRYHVLDGRRRPRPVWVPGEIHISSEVGLARGYWRDPERTARQFVTLPETGERAYASGDIGRYLPSGDIEILGRADFQVKIQGIRIELGEIEAVLAQHPQVRAAVVVASRKVRDLPTLHGYVVCDDAAPSPEQLRTFVAERLPTAMVPSRIVLLDRLPLTGNGKIDRLALAAGPSGAQPGGGPGCGFVPPASALDRRVCELCAEVLGAQRVGMQDDFFLLGGDSLGAVELAVRVNAELGADLTVATVLATPVVGDLCAALVEVSG